MRRILFVDDDARALESLRARLHSYRSSWHMQFVGSGAAAVAELERVEYDVLVTDLKMPHMDGAELLAITRKRWPGTFRVLLSAATLANFGLRVMSLAHRFLAKPCNVSELECGIDRSFKLRELLQSPALHAAVGRIERLAAAPEIYLTLQRELENQQVTAKSIAAIVSSDPVIAGKVLQVVNSAFFRLSRRITRVEDAVNYLGFAAIRNLVLSVEVFSTWPAQSPAALLKPEELQSHVKRVTTAVRALTTGTPLCDDAMLAALMHDIGYWVMMQEYPQELQKAFEVAGKAGISLIEAERQVTGLSHAEIGAYLLGLWDLPFNVIEAVAFHHTPTAIPPNGFDALAALAVAYALAREQAPQSPLYLDGTPIGIDGDFLKATGAPFDWNEARRRVHAALEEGQAA